MADNQKTYLDKEKDMVKAICANDGAPMFDSKDEGLDFLGKTLEEFPKYVNAVVHYTTRMPIISAQYEGEEFRDQVTRLDRQRKAQHDVAIDAINILNRVSGRMGLEPFAEVDTTNRQAVADFCGRYVNETFNHGIGGTMDQLTKDANKSYDPSKTRERLGDLDRKFGHIQTEHGADAQYQP